MSGKPDPNKLSPKESRICMGKLADALHRVSYVGDVKIRFRAGAPYQVELTQSLLPKDILDERVLCVMLRSDNDEESGKKGGNPSSS